jgi:hypothetical protein
MQDWAFYYPGPTWVDSDVIKNMILFFDGLPMLVPDYLHDKPLISDPAVAAGLLQHGLLKQIHPEQFVDKEAAEQLATQMTDIITSGVLDSLETSIEFHELSMSRLGYYGDAGLAQMIFEELANRGLARETPDGKSIPMHPTVRILVLTLLAQILGPRGAGALNVGLSPWTDRPELIRALFNILNLPGVVTAGHVVQADLTEVGVDLSAVPIEDVLEFRAQNQRSYRVYMRELRRFVREMPRPGGPARDQSTVMAKSCGSISR